MREEEKNFFESWKKKRERGKSNYIIVSGVLVHAIFAILVVSILQMFMEKNFSFSILTTPESIKSTLIFTVLFAVAGVMVTSSKWNKNEQRFNILKTEIRPKPKNRKSL